MDLLAVSPTAIAGVGLIGLYACYLVYTGLSLRAKHAAFRARTGSYDAPAVARLPFLWGIDVMRDNIKTVREDRVLPTELDMFRDMGSNTWSTLLLGTKFINTAEPENLKTMMAVDFKKWGLGEQRKRVFRPLLGEGRITATLDIVSLTHRSYRYLHH